MRSPFERTSDDDYSSFEPMENVSRVNWSSVPPFEGDSSIFDDF